MSSAKEYNILVFTFNEGSLPYKKNIHSTETKVDFFSWPASVVSYFVVAKKIHLTLRLTQTTLLIIVNKQLTPQFLWCTQCFFYCYLFPLVDVLSSSSLECIKNIRQPPWLIMEFFILAAYAEVSEIQTSLFHLTS